MTRALPLLALLLGCSAPAPLADSWDPPSEEPTTAGSGGTGGEEPATDPVPAAGKPSLGGAGAGGQPTSGGAGQGGLAGQPTAAAGAAGRAEEPPCCSGHYNGVGQCVVDSSPACAPPSCGDGEEATDEGECCTFTSLCASPPSGGPCPSYDRLRLCHAPGGTMEGCAYRRTFPLDEHGFPVETTECASQQAECETDGDACRPAP